MKVENNNIIKEIQLSADIISKSSNLTPKIEKSINLIIEAIKNGNKVILFGNGGSAADAQHIAAELMGKFQLKRRSYPAIALTDNSSTVTAVGNDFSFDEIVGVKFNLMLQKWYRSKDSSVNYISTFIKN